MIELLCSESPGMTWFVPEGYRVLIGDNVSKLSEIYEMSWFVYYFVFFCIHCRGERKAMETIDGIVYEIYCLPAQCHVSESLWCSWAVIGPTKRFYFSGWTGFCEEEFGKIGKKLGPFDLSAIAIGHYSPQ